MLMHSLVHLRHDGGHLIAKDDPQLGEVGREEGDVKRDPHRLRLGIHLQQPETAEFVERLPGVVQAELAVATLGLRHNRAVESAVHRHDRLFVLREERGLHADERRISGDKDGQGDANAEEDNQGHLQHHEALLDSVELEELLRLLDESGQVEELVEGVG